MKSRLIAFGLVASVGVVSSVQAVDITGAGATFIYPILSKWSAT